MNPEDSSVIGFLGKRLTRTGRGWRDEWGDGSRDATRLETQVCFSYLQFFSLLTIFLTHISTKYFSQITSLHFLHPTTAATTIYIPPIIFYRNVHLVPHLVRVADLFWAGAGLSGHYRTSTICPLTSVYSLPLSLVDLVSVFCIDVFCG
jgi:hypothetical protein